MHPRSPSALVRTALLCAFGFATAWPASLARAAGTLAPTASGAAPMRIVDHHVAVRIDNGFARTEVTQTFENPNDSATEAIYSLPLPLGAALSEMMIEAADQTLYGEVVPAAEAEAIYQTQQSAGEQAGLATKDGYQRFEFRIAAIPAGERATLSFAYYQALSIDNGVGRYLYPLQEGGTDEEAEAFWTQNERVDGVFTADITLRSAWPVEDVRIPDFGSAATITQLSPNEVHAELSAQANLDQDLVLYYRLPDDLPGRVEVIPYREDPEGPGTFMMVLTPGLDLAELGAGRDHVFLVDVSGSMESKLDTVKQAVVGAMRELQSGDRYRIFTFSDTARELTAGWVEADVEGLGPFEQLIGSLSIEGGTNLFSGMELALGETDRDRATAVYLVTDAVANEGVLDPQRFAEVVHERDVRVFGLLMGNSANWPLMQLITETSGGFYSQVSTADDVMGQILLAREKTTHEAIVDFQVTIDGGETFDLTHNATRVHHGQQVVIFGRYAEPGPASFSVDATITGHSRRFEGRFELPSEDGSNPELERLWAFESVRWLEYQAAVGLSDPTSAAEDIARLGVDYQLVTDETSMVLLTDEAFAELGIDPNNRERAEREAQARALREQGEPVQYEVPVDDGFVGPAATPGTGTGAGASGHSGHGSSGGFGLGGGGAVSPCDASALLLLGLALLWARRRSSAA